MTRSLFNKQMATSSYKKVEELWAVDLVSTSNTLDSSHPFHASASRSMGSAAALDFNAAQVSGASPGGSNPLPGIGASLSAPAGNGQLIGWVARSVHGGDHSQFGAISGSKTMGWLGMANHAPASAVEKAPSPTLSSKASAAATAPQVAVASTPLFPSSLTVVGGTLFFVATTDDNGAELWTSDGTASGTVLVKDINPDTENGVGTGSNPYGLTAVGNTLFFSAYTNAAGAELWKSDGTANGTVLVKDINSGSYSSNADQLTAVGNTLFFSAYTDAAGDELWKSDGTPNGTVLVKDITSGSDGSSADQLTAVGNTLFFSASTAATGNELWKSNGTTTGTVLVKDINIASYYGYGYSSYPECLTAVGSTLFFSASTGYNGYGLWKSDGTSNGTVLVKQINTTSDYYGNVYGYGSNPYGLTAVGNTLFFYAYTDAEGTELWKSDGTASGTVLVKDINPDTDTENGLGIGSNPYRLTAVGNTLFFTASTSAYGNELWKSNATDGTVLVKDINADVLEGLSVGSDPRDLTAVGNTLFFAAHTAATGYELWTSDGTANGTVMVSDINTESGQGSNPTEFRVIGNVLVFVATDSEGVTELWKSDGTSDGTVRLASSSTPFPQPPAVQNISVSGNNVYLKFSAAITQALPASTAFSVQTFSGSTITALTLSGLPTLDTSVDPTGATIKLVASTSPSASVGLRVTCTSPAGAFAAFTNVPATTFSSAATVATLAPSYNNLNLTGTSAINGTGNTNANMIIGNGKVNVMTGGEGIDSMDGGDSADLYFIASSLEHTAAEITDSGSSGVDELRFASITASQTLNVYAGDTGLEQVSIGTGSATTPVLTATTTLGVNASLAPNGLTILGNAGINAITGSAFADVINAGLGLDVLDGKDGGDVYIIASSADRTAAEIKDTGSSGVDELRFASTTASQTLIVYATETGLERVTIGTGTATSAVQTATTALNVDASQTPNALSISGNAGVNIITGTAFTDSLDGGLAGDIYNIANSGHHSAAEISDSGSSGLDELRFASITASQILDVYAGDTGLEQVSIGTGSATTPVLTATTTLGVNASLAPNGLTILGNAGINAITGSAFADVINAGLGLDVLDGKDGGDVYIIASSADRTAAEITDSGSSGVDELRFASITASQTLNVYAGDTGLEQVSIGTGSATTPVLTATTTLGVNASLAPNGLTILGNAGINAITGSAFTDVINAGLGLDVLDGKDGADVYIIASSADRTAAEIKDSGSSGVDELRFSSITASQTLTVYATETGLEKVSIGTGTAATPVSTGTTALNVDASQAPNALSIRGNAGVNIVTGTAFTDSLDGGESGDFYNIANNGHHSAAEISDSGSSGVDELRFSSITASQILDVYAGDTGLEQVSIGTGTATIPVLTAATTLGVNASLAPNGLTILGNAGINAITGSAFTDVINAGLGLDVLDGKDGADVYIIASSADRTAAEIKDSGSSGVDELRFSSITASQTLTVYATETGLEKVSIGTGTAATPVSTGTTALNVDASQAPNALSIRGNAGVNIITGTAFTDSLDGGESGDFYNIANNGHHSAAEISDSGSSGVDELRFSSITASQILDVYAGDTGLEQVSIGTGTATIPVLTATTTLGVNASLAPNGLTILGNAGINAITGSAFTDVINAGLGLDVLDGKDGADVYIIASSADRTAAEIKDSGSSGVDELRFSSITASQTLTVYATETGLEKVSIGTGTATSAVQTATTALNVNASAAANGLVISGNAGINTIIGSGFADQISGNAGNDSIIGGLGNDTVSGGAGQDIFRFDTTPNASTNSDVILDFSLTDLDTIQLENAVYTVLITTGVLAAGALASVGSVTTSSRILYDGSNGQLFYDSDGSNSNPAVLFATISSGLSIASLNGRFSVT